MEKLKFENAIPANDVSEWGEILGTQPSNYSFNTKAAQDMNTKNNCDETCITRWRRGKYSETHNIDGEDVVFEGNVFEVQFKDQDALDNKEMLEYVVRPCPDFCGGFIPILELFKESNLSKVMIEVLKKKLNTKLSQLNEK